MSKTGGRKRRDAAAQPTGLHIQSSLDLLSLNLFACWIFTIFSPCSNPFYFHSALYSPLYFQDLDPVCSSSFISLFYLVQKDDTTSMTYLFAKQSFVCTKNKKIPPFTCYSHVHWTQTRYFYSFHLYFMIYLYIYHQVQTRLHPNVFVCVITCQNHYARLCLCWDFFLPSTVHWKQVKQTARTPKSPRLCSVNVCVCYGCKGNHILRTASHPSSLCHFLFSALVLVSLHSAWPWPLGGRWRGGSAASSRHQFHIRVAFPTVPPSSLPFSIHPSPLACHPPPVLPFLFAFLLPLLSPFPLPPHLFSHSLLSSSSLPLRNVVLRSSWVEECCSNKPIHNPRGGSLPTCTYTCTHTYAHDILLVKFWP